MTELAAQVREGRDTSCIDERLRKQSEVHLGWIRSRSVTTVTTGYRFSWEGEDRAVGCGQRKGIECCVLHPIIKADLQSL